LTLPYDIFRKLPDGTPIWIEAVASLDMAKARLSNLRDHEPGDYIVYDASHSRFIAVGADSPATGATGPSV
jgi:hypothetical protein